MSSSSSNDSCSEEDSDEVVSEAEGDNASSLFHVQLAIVDQSFGPKSDLYRDVLGVKPNATPEQIQRAYFQRRNELFQLLAEMGGGESPHSASSDDEAGDDSEDTGDDNVHHSSNPTTLRTRSAQRSAAAKRLNVERKMDAVVMAMRVLGDPELRSRYDDVRTDRLRGRPSPLHATQGGGDRLRHQQHLHAETIRVQSMKPSKKAPSKQRANMSSRTRSGRRSTAPSSSTSTPPRSKNARATEAAAAYRSARATKNKKESRVVTPEMPASRKSPKTSLFSFSAKKSRGSAVTSSSARGQRVDSDDRDRNASDNDDTTLDNHTYTDEGTLLSETSDGTRMTTRKKGFVQRVADEVMGAIEDTTASFDQVFNVFTLQEEDIRAVRLRIDKVRRQIEHSM